MSRYTSSSAYNQLLIAHIMSKITFMKYLSPARSKMAPELKMFKIYFYYYYIFSNIPVSISMSKTIFIKYLPPVWPKLVTNLKVLRIYWSLAHLIFQICRSSTFDISNIAILILMSKIIIYQIFTNSWAQIGPKMKNTQNLLKFDKNWNLIRILDKNYFWH